MGAGGSPPPSAAAAAAADADPRTGRFLAWAARHGLALDGAAVAGGLVPGGRGLVATADLPEGHILFRVRRDATLSPATSPAGAAAAAAAGVTGVPALAVTLVVEGARGGASPWAPYLDILPRGEALAHLPLLWPPALHARAGGVLAPAARRRAALTRLYRDQVAGALAAAVAAAAAEAAGAPAAAAAADAAAPAPPPPPPAATKEGLLTAFLEAAALVGCNAFDVDAPPGAEGGGAAEGEGGEAGGGAVAMVPAADLLNHRTGWNNARLYFEADALHMVTITPVAAGAQLYNTYGPELNNAGLAAAYGFTNHPNPNPPATLSSAELTARLPPGPRRRAAAAHILALHTRAGLAPAPVANFAVGGDGAFTRPLLEVLGIVGAAVAKGGRGGGGRGGPRRGVALLRRRRGRRPRRGPGGAPGQGVDACGGGGCCSGGDEPPPPTSACGGGDPPALPAPPAAAVAAADRAAGLAALAAAVAARAAAVAAAPALAPAAAAATPAPVAAAAAAAAAAVADDVRAEAARVWAAAGRRVAAAVAAAGASAGPSL